VSPKHAPRRALIAFHDVAARQVRLLSDDELLRLDPYLVRISLDPSVGKERASGSPLREYTAPGVRVLFVASALGRVVVVAYVEID
jgi:hypothetical protein